MIKEVVLYMRVPKEIKETLKKNADADGFSMTVAVCQLIIKDDKRRKE